ncbi:MAG: hypothetical protein LBQ86_05365 [Holophagales bacterium]|jgi:hypothetical protein|nr:hypothetical protein [Holophagales bacterium]
MRANKLFSNLTAILASIPTVGRLLLTLLLAFCPMPALAQPVAQGKKDQGLKTQDVYVAARSFWKKGALQHLGNGFANSVFVAGNDVYVAGHEPNAQGKDVATLWKNGKAQRLGDEGSWANSVFVAGKDVYVAGNKTDAKGDSVTILWKNGVTQYINNFFANSIFVAGKDVYVAGALSGRALLWKNGVVQSLSVEGIEDYNYLDRKARASSVFVSGNDVYVAGTVFLMGGGGTLFATLWKNGVAQRLYGDEKNNTTEAYSVYVSGNDVYVVGVELDQGRIATLWKNGVPQRLGSNGDYYIGASVFALGDDVYVAGCRYDWVTKKHVVTLWENGVPQLLSDDMPADYHISSVSVFVK